MIDVDAVWPAVEEAYRGGFEWGDGLHNDTILSIWRQGTRCAIIRIRSGGAATAQLVR